MHFCAKFLLGYKMHLVSTGEAVSSWILNPLLFMITWAYFCKIWRNQYLKMLNLEQTDQRSF